MIREYPYFRKPPYLHTCKPCVSIRATTVIKTYNDRWLTMIIDWHLACSNMTLTKSPHFPSISSQHDSAKITWGNSAGVGGTTVAMFARNLARFSGWTPLEESYSVGQLKTFAKQRKVSQPTKQVDSTGNVHHPPKPIQTMKNTSTLANEQCSKHVKPLCCPLYTHGLRTGFPSWILIMPKIPLIEYNRIIYHQPTRKVIISSIIIR